MDDVCIMLWNTEFNDGFGYENRNTLWSNVYLWGSVTDQIFLTVKLIYCVIHGLLGR